LQHAAFGVGDIVGIESGGVVNVEFRRREESDVGSARR
jgi:hypothetical protein